MLYYNSSSHTHLSNSLYSSTFLYYNRTTNLNYLLILLKYNKGAEISVILQFSESTKLETDFEEFVWFHIKEENRIIYFIVILIHLIQAHYELRCRVLSTNLFYPNLSNEFMFHPYNVFISLILLIIIIILIPKYKSESLSLLMQFFKMWNEPIFSSRFFITFMPCDFYLLWQRILSVN